MVNPQQAVDARAVVESFNDYVGPYEGDPQVGHLSTPISDSKFTRTFIGNLPAYRRGISPLQRGLEVGLAHGYFILGPLALLGPVRDYPETAYLGGLISTIGLILIATAAMTVYGLTAFPQDETKPDYLKADQLTPQASQSDRQVGDAALVTPEDLKTSAGWSQFTGSFFVGATGGAFVAYFLLENISVIDAMIRGGVNV